MVPGRALAERTPGTRKRTCGFPSRSRSARPPHIFSGMFPEPRARRRFAFVGAGAIGFAVLLWPAAPPDVDLPAETAAFRWDADELFAALEAEFTRAGATELGEATDVLDGLETEGSALLSRVAGSDEPPFDALARLSSLQFELAVQGAAHPSLLPRADNFFVGSRLTLMKAATVWPTDRATHEALYRVLFGGRIALDEALIQAGTDALAPLLHIEDIPSSTPSILVEGVRIHSGDVLLSRGGAPTSALIARGNDFPNTFSHAALAHVDPESGEGTVIESLIETGSVLSTVEEYLESKKHRILVLRLRPDHPALVGDPLLPHRAAEAMLARVREEHIPYDFAMDWDDPSTVFCSEIVFHAFRERGVDLWTVRSAMSAPGLVSWLAAMGVREFTSLVPSDVEYDPQLRAVVEWRDAQALMDFRLDNAIIDALLEEADLGAELSYAWYALPLARVLKLFSVGQSLFGGLPTIPKGMSASTALKVDALVSKVHPAVRDELVVLAADFPKRNGYEAPYWVLVQLARDAVAARRESLAPALAIQ